MGMPRPEPGPVSDRLMPTFTSAIAAEANKAARATSVLWIFIRVSCGVGEKCREGCAIVPPPSARRHPQRTIEPDYFAIEVPVRDDVAGQLGALLGFAPARRERNGCRSEE